MAVKVKALAPQSCPTLFDSLDYSPPGSSVHEILQARILEWVAISSPGDLPDPGIQPGSPALLLLLSHFSRVRLCATP